MLRSAFCSWLIVFVFGHSLSQAADVQSSTDPDFHFDQAPGKFSVGFHVVEQYDRSRLFKTRIDRVTGAFATGERARPLQTLVWYPSEASATPMRYDDYLALAGTEDDFGRPAADAKRVADERLKEIVPREMSLQAITNIKAQRMWALRNAVPIAQKFPVVIYAPSFSASGFENADICEYLASHGYVVLASPSMSADSRWMSQDLAGVTAQVDDIEFLVGYAATMPNVDSAHVSVIGYSWGGIANVFAAAKDDRIRALVGFDGGIRLVGKLVAEAKYVTPERVTIPFLYLSSSPGTLEDLYRQKQDLSDDFLARLTYADLYMVTMLPLVHYQFASEHLRFLPTQPSPMFPGDYSRREVAQAYGLLARYTLDFLDGVLRNDKRSLALVEKAPDATEFPAHQISVQVTKRAAVAPTRESFAEQLNARGFQNAGDVYKEFKQTDDAWELKGPEFSDWIQELLFLHRNQDAEAMAKLFAQVYPTRPGPYFWLATIYKEMGNQTAAIANLRKVIDLNPNDKFAKSQLAELTKK